MLRKIEGSLHGIEMSRSSSGDTPSPAPPQAVTRSGWDTKTAARTNRRARSSSAALAMASRSEPEATCGKSFADGMPRIEAKEAGADTGGRTGAIGTDVSVGAGSMWEAGVENGSGAAALAGSKAGSEAGLGEIVGSAADGGAGPRVETGSGGARGAEAAAKAGAGSGAGPAEGSDDTGATGWGTASVGVDRTCGAA